MLIVRSTLFKTLRKGRARERRDAARALGRTGDRACTDALIRAARHPDPWVRQAAVEALGRLADPESASTLVQVLAEHAGKAGPLDSRIARDAAAGLVALGPAAGPPLLEALASDSLRDHAARLLGGIRYVDAVGPLIDLLGEQSARSPYPDAEYLGAAEALAAMGEAAVDALIDALDGGGSASPRTDVACVLGLIGDSRAAGPLLRCLDEASHPDLFAEALGRIGDPQAVPALLALLAERETRFPGNEATDWRTRRCAAEALSAIGDPSCAGTLLGTLEDETHVWNARLAAGHALAGLGERRAVPMLMAVAERLYGVPAGDRPLPDDETGEKAACLAGSLERLTEPEQRRSLVGILADAADPLPDDLLRVVASAGTAAVEPLIAVVSDQGRALHARADAARALAMIGDATAASQVEAATSALEAAASAVAELASEVHPAFPGYTLSPVWKPTVEALATLGGPVAEAWFRSAMGNPDARLRRSLCQALSRSRDEGFVTLFGELLADPDSEVAGLPAASLGRIGGEKAVGLLLNSRPAAAAPWAIVSALAETGDPLGASPAVRLLPELGLTESYPDLVGETLAGFGEAAVGPLIEALTHPSESVRIAATTALEQIASPRSVAAMIAALEDDAPRVQAAAARALGRIGDAAALDPLHAALARPADPFWGQDEIIAAILEIEDAAEDEGPPPD